MSYNTGPLLPSLYGRRVGLLPMTSAATGTGKTGLGAVDFLVGPEDFRRGVTTAETTGVNVPAWGVSFIGGTSAGSSSVYVLDPPIPGVSKTLVFNTTANGVYVKTLNSETFLTTQGSSFTVIKSTAGGVIHMFGATTAVWAPLNITSGTTSNASGFALTTTT